MNEFWKGRRVFVTGANGFLGGHLCEELVALGAEVFGLIRDDVPSAYFVDNGIQNKIVSVHGDLADAFLLERVYNEYEIDTTFHLAAQPIVTIANRSPRSTFESNIAGTWNLLEAARKYTGTRAVIVASSDKAYGDSKQLPYVEDQPLAAKNPYDLSKTCTDLLAQSYFHTYQLPVVVSRCGNFYGPGDLNWSRIIPGGFRSFLNEETLVIRSDGSPIRDYFFVKDVVNAYLVLGEHATEEGVLGEAYNFGTGTHVSVLELIEKMKEAANVPNAQIDVTGKAKNEIDAQYLSYDKAKKRFNWDPQTSLEDGLKETFKWYQSYVQR